MRYLLYLFSVSFLVLSGCGSKSDQEYFETASQKLDEGKTIEAIKDFEDLIKDFPNSEFTRQAMYKMGSLYQGNLIGDKNPKESMRKAIEYYIKVYEKDPTKAEAPNALFMGAFLLANEMKDYSQAEKYYKLFIEKYPSHDLTSSAKAELTYLGKSPEEILKENVASGEELK